MPVAAKAQQELAKDNVKVDILWKGPLKEDQSAEQISVVEDMFNNNVDAIVLAPNDASACRRWWIRRPRRIFRS